MQSGTSVAWCAAPLACGGRARASAHAASGHTHAARVGQGAGGTHVRCRATAASVSTVNLPPTATVTPADFSNTLSSDPGSLFTPAFLEDVGGAVEADDISTGTAYITMASPPSPPPHAKRGSSILESESGGTGVVATSARALLMAAGATLTALLMAM
jgi:hypothetical protein